jgi:hypothetical protein
VVGGGGGMKHGAQGMCCWRLQGRHTSVKLGHCSGDESDHKAIWSHAQHIAWRCPPHPL